MTEHFEVPTAPNESEKLEPAKSPAAIDARPVLDWENHEVKGEALLSKRRYDEHASKVERLRKRQQAYEESLPLDPREAMSAIIEANPGMEDYSESQYAVRASLEIIHQLLTHDAIDKNPQIISALYWLTEKGLSGVDAIETGTSRVSDIAARFSTSHKPYRA